MGRPHQVAARIRSGHSPQAIARIWGISHASVVQYLDTAVGHGLLSRSEILFAIEDKVASHVEAAVTSNGIRTFGDIREKFRRLGLKLTREQEKDVRRFDEEAHLYFRLRDAPLADMYESLCRLETYLHAYIRTRLERGFGPQDWWLKGIPESVRIDCVTAKERDPEPQDDPYCYTTFIHLRDILDKQWGIFCELLPKSVVDDKKAFLKDLGKLNAVRNKIMHPVRGYRPTRQDFDFVKEFTERMFAE
jgi:predicted transcriptional regulator